MTRSRSRALAALAACVLAGCASTAIDDNVAAAHADVRSFAHVDFQWLASDAARTRARSDVDAALAQPLSADDATRIALSYDPALQALLFEHAAASADATQSARVPNPVFEFERLASGGTPDHLEVTRSLTLPIAELLLWPARSRAADATQRRLRLQLARDVLRHAGEARRAWVAAVADAQSARCEQQYVDAAELAAELARRLEATGYFSALERARAESFGDGAAIGIAQARRTARASREALVRVLGLDAAQAARLTLPEQLPALPSQLPADEAERALMQSALDNRLDVRLAKARLEAVARAQGFTTAGRVVDGLALGAARKSETGQAEEHGIALALPLPVFDTGDAARAGAQARYEAALQRTAALGIAAASQLRAAQGDVRDTWELARRLSQGAVPRQAEITRETLLRYDAMLASPFDLLSQAGAQARNGQLGMGAQRDYWLADAAWQDALVGAPAGDDVTAEAR